MTRTGRFKALALATRIIAREFVELVRETPGVLAGRVNAAINRLNDLDTLRATAPEDADAWLHVADGNPRYALDLARSGADLDYAAGLKLDGHSGDEIYNRCRAKIRNDAYTFLARGGWIKPPGPNPVIGGTGCVFPMSDSVRAYLSPAELVLPGPNGPLHIRGAYSGQPAEITEIDMDDLEDERT